MSRVGIRSLGGFFHDDLDLPHVSVENLLGTEAVDRSLFSRDLIAFGEDAVEVVAVGK